jgi:hypothetical protein
MTEPTFDRRDLMAGAALMSVSALAAGGASAQPADDPAQRAMGAEPSGYLLPLAKT